MPSIISEISPTPAGEDVRCPACGAWQEWSDACRRCRCELTLLRRAAAAVESSRRGALRALRAGRIAVALHHARRWYALAPGTAPARLLAVCLLLDGDFPAAAAAARLADRLTKDTGPKERT